ncbi:chemotaxis protein CheW [Pseudomonadales bacterium]|jgi:purine-binding chemotaxis protein CheW|nr:chemotaxis protein CheW [Pseudomonadales bacterium]MDB0050512.1 chemotaxis protein CheW [Pseudomonadales bacterium]MDB9756082.1 chemotaxis protein CheW [Pseudomonadales bacterium]
MLYSTFKLGNTFVGVPITSILEIPRSSVFHSVRGAPPVIDGLINLRGKIITVINLGLAFGLEKVEASEESRIYIFKNDSEFKEVADSDQELKLSEDNIGLHVERIAGVISVEEKELQPIPKNMVHPYYESVVRKDDDFIIILKLSKILNLEQDSGEFHE